jgi:D-cysteine desulfhydrase
MSDIRAALERLPRFSLATLPTPLEDLPALSRHLGGPRILMKRDDLTGFALGGNKSRKLEFLVADALRKGCTTLLTAGAAQSNHCRQTAAAAAKAGLACELILGGSPEDATLPPGNLMLDLLFGAKLHWTERARRLERMAEVAEELSARGRRPYVIPYGGSNPVGAVGYLLAYLEFVEQCIAQHVTPDTVIVGSSSGGTQAGMMAGAAVAETRAVVKGISIDKGERDPVPFEEELAGLANGVLELVGDPKRVSPADAHVEYGYLGGGYGVVGPLELEAISLLARLEGIVLDPVYAGRAMGAMIDMIRNARIDRGETVVFWHTGGSPALFAYTAELMPSLTADR